MSYATRTAVFRGLKTGWIAEGPEDAPILFCIHGYPDTATCWSAQIDQFKKKFRVIAPYARGARPSEATNDVDRYSVNSIALDHLSILKVEDPQERADIYILGHDIGGVQAWHLAPMLGERLKGLVVFNSFPGPVMTQRLKTQPMQWLRSWYILPFLIPMVSDPILRRFPGKLLQLTHTIGKLSPEHRPRLAKSLPGVVNPAKHYRAFFQIRRLLNSPLPGRVKCPVLVVWGEEEAFLERIRHDELARFADDVVIRVLKGGHWIHREDAENVNQLLEDFLC